MIVVMKPEATKEQIDHMIKRIEEIGLKSVPIYGTLRTVIAAVGDKREFAQQMLEGAPGVERVVPILAPYKIASREVKPEKSVITIDHGATLGGTRVGVIAGPCTVEGRQQTLELAEAVKEAGAVALRGGAFKPRTNPYSFQGLREEGLQYLAEARERTGLAVVTEVLASQHVPMVAAYADVLQVGARNMQNYVLLEAVGRVDKPVLLKRGPSATIEELLLAAEYVLRQGNPNVILCERGIRTFETHTRYTLALASVPHLVELTHLPVIVDPSHGTGRASLVEPMCLAAVAAGADGLIIEVHADPEAALVDGAQSLTPAQFATLMTKCRAVAQAVGREL
jgi:3-deoxy-7-phosphoheptulonate synthase